MKPAPRPLMQCLGKQLRQVERLLHRMRRQNGLAVADGTFHLTSFPSLPAIATADHALCERLHVAQLQKI